MADGAGEEAGTRAVGGEYGYHARHRGSGLVALAVVGGLPWRAAWLAFVAAAVLSAIMHALLLPGIPAGGTGRRGNVVPGRRDLGLFRKGSAALFAVALSFGVVNAFYWSFNADIVSSAGLLLPNAGPILYAVLRAAGFAGLLTGDVVDRFGLERTLRLTLLCLGAGAVLLGVAPGSLDVVGASVVLYGAGVMFMSALLSLWSSAVLEERPSEGFTAALIFFGFGGVVGPAALGRA